MPQEKCAFLLLSTTSSSALPTSPVKLSAGAVQERWALRVQKKNTPYAAQTAAADAAKTALDAGLKRVDVFVKGPGSGRESAIRSISQSGIEVISIKDVTPLPHNGCRPPKQRRV